MRGRSVFPVCASRCFASALSPAARNFLEWYAQGINAYVTQHADDLPVELKIAGFMPSFAACAPVPTVATSCMSDTVM